MVLHIWSNSRFFTLAFLSIQKTRKLHPLFGRGFDTPLSMRVTNQAVRVSLPGSAAKDGKEAIVLNTQLHKV